jgi:hypothetical protein
LRAALREIFGANVCRQTVSHYQFCTRAVPVFSIVAGPPTLLSGALLAHLNVKQMDDVIAWTYADTAWARFAALAPIVFAHYETDQVC